MVVSINVSMLVIISYVKWDILIIGKTITVTKLLISHTQVIHISKIFLVLENKLFPKKTSIEQKREVNRLKEEEEICENGCFVRNNDV